MQVELKLIIYVSDSLHLSVLQKGTAELLKEAYVYHKDLYVHFQCFYYEVSGKIPIHQPCSVSSESF